jgi:hypothetical protein
MTLTRLVLGKNASNPCLVPDVEDSHINSVFD